MINNKIFGLAVGQIFLIVLSVFAIASIIGESNLVRGQEFPDEDPTKRQATGTLNVGSKTNAVADEPKVRGGFQLVEEGADTGTTGGAPGGETSTGADESFSIGGFVGSIFSGSIAGDSIFLGGLISGAAWGATVYGLTKYFAGLAGAEDGLADALAAGLGAGIAVGRFLYVSKVAGTITSQTATLIGIGFAVAVFALLYKKEKKKAINFQCLPWEAPLGGANCEKCNEDEFRPCSEYRCKSLGQACDIVNAGTEDEKCVWVNPRDVTSPTITPWKEPLTERHSYTNHATRPTSLGTQITRTDASNGCIRAFTPLEFGIQTNEAAQCKVDYIHTETFEDMEFFFGESNFYMENHEQKLSLPSPDSINSESPELENDGIYDLFVRCRDANGNENVDEYVFSFCVDPSPDTTPPIIIDTSILSESFVAFEVEEVEISLFINEPAECKWDINDRDYEEMANSMICSTSFVEQNSDQLYPCTTTLTGIEDRAENIYYFRCKDQPSKKDSERNVNSQSYVFSLLGSQPLNIIDVKPDNETITGSTDIVSVDLELETSNGAEEGKATCYFSESGEQGTFVEMFETDNFAHKQTLTLSGGNYEYFFRCVDAGGNSDEATAQFKVFSDNLAPLVTRAYRDIDALKIVTDEEAECAYSLNNCNYVFEEGIPMLVQDNNMVHFSQWQPNLPYYIKCRDEYNNQPNPNECSIIASATNIE